MPMKREQSVFETDIIKLAQALIIYRQVKIFLK